MNQDKMHIVNKIFNNETIRTVWDKEQEKFFISGVDIEENETVTNCHQLKEIDGIFDPPHAAQRAIDLYRAKGYDYKLLI